MPRRRQQSLRTVLVGLLDNPEELARFRENPRAYIEAAPLTADDRKDLLDEKCENVRKKLRPTGKASLRRGPGGGEIAAVFLCGPPPPEGN